MPTIDRNARARFLFHAEALDRRTRLKGQHGGVLKRSGLAVLKALLFCFQNVLTGRCDPSYEALANASGVSQSTAAVALRRLEREGLLTRIRRQAGRIRYTNAYSFPFARKSVANHPPHKNNLLSAKSVPAFAATGRPEEAAADARAYLRRAREILARQRSRQSLQPG